jgi:VCBS repeat-containing protein
MAAQKTFNGTIGNDLISGTTGADKMAGGTGDDTYIVNSTQDDVIEKNGGGTDTVLSSVSYALSANVENLTLTGDSALNGTGNALNNVIIGNSASNVLDGGAGADAMTGGAGNDTYVVDDAADSVAESAGEGRDTVLSSISYQLGANVEDLMLSGNAGINATGNAQNNVLTGNGGNNVLDGGAGADAMAGAAGNDTYIVDDAGDVVTESAGQGADTVQSTIAYTLGANVENLTLNGTAAIDGTGNALSNVITGNGGANILNGGAGADLMAGGGGNDTYIVDSWGDMVIEGQNQGIDTVYSSVSYTLSSNVENLVLTGDNGYFDVDVAVGNALDNVIVGDAGLDILAGRAGNDTITGGGGLDYVDGGSGFDTAVYSGAFSDYKISSFQVNPGFGDWSRDANDDRAGAQAAPSALVLNGAVVDDLRAGDPDGTDYVRNVEALRFSDRTIYIDGRNNAAILSADVRNLTEADSASAISTSGRLTIRDFDGAETFVPQSATAGAYGTFSIGTDGTWSYSASSAHDEFAAGSTHTDAFDVRSADGTRTTVTINIAGTNDAAVLSSATVHLEETNAAPTTGGQLTVSDVDSAAAFVAQSNVAGSYGQFSIAANGTWSYTANSAFDELNVGGTLSDTFAVASADGTSTSVSVSINGTNDAAVLSSATVSLNETNAALTTGGQLTVSDVDSAAAFVAQSNVAGSYGQFSIDATGTWSYTANSAFDELNVGGTLSDTFAVASADGTSTSVSVSINGTNDAAVLSSATVSLNETNAALTTGGQLTVSDVDSAAAFVAQSNVAGSYGEFSIAADGIWSYAANSAFDELNSGDTRSDTFAVASADGTTTSVVVSINGTNDAAVLSSASVNLDETNAALTTGGQLTVSDIDSAATFVAQSNVAGSYGEFSIAADGTWSYAANSAFDELNVGDTRSDTFAVASADGTTTSVLVSINGTNDAAVLSSATVSLNETNAALTTGGQLTVSDIDSAAAFVAQSSVAGSYGEFSIAVDGTWSYAANSAFDELNIGDSRSDTFAVASADGTTTSVAVTISGANDGPVAVDDTNEADAVIEAGVTAGDATAAGNVLANDTDVDTGDTKTVSAVNGVALNVGVAIAGTYGSVVIGANGAYTYTLDNADIDTNSLAAGAAATDAFNYTVSDGLGATSTAILTIDITGGNDAPVATNLNAPETFTEDTPRNLTDIVVSDVDGGNVTATLTLSNPVAGALSTATSGSVTSTYNASAGVWSASGAIASVNALLAGVTLNPAANFNGNFTIATSVTDGVAPAITGVKAITGVAVNDAPVLDASKAPVLASQSEDAGAPTGAVGTLVSSLANLNPPAGGLDNVTDPDSGAVTAIAVTGSNSANGSWWYSTSNGASWSALGTVSDASARLLAADAGTRLYFQPNTDFNGTNANAITFRAWDMTSGSAGSVANVSANGGATAFSSTSDTASLTIDAVNDAPKVTAPAPNTFQILSLTANNAQAIEVNTATGDDRGGIAVSPTRVFLTGDLATARADATTLGNLAGVGTRYDGIVQNIADGHVYTLSTNGVNPYANGGAGSFTHLLGIDGSTGALDGTRITLSTAITPTANNTGIFSGYNRADIVNGTGAVFNIDFPTGTVTNVGTVPQPSSLMLSTENWARWGVSEFYDGQLYLAYRPADFGSRIDHVNVATGAVSTIATFSSLSELASFTVSPSLGKWYFHYEGGAQFRMGGDETLGFADATFRTSSGSTVYTATEQVAMNLKNTGWSVSDVDSGNGAVTVTLAVQEGTLNLLAGTSGAIVTNNNSSAVTVTGTVAQINALLNTDASSVVSYTDGSDAPSANDTLTLSINDNGLTGSGGAKTASGSAAIAITAVNDAPVAVNDSYTVDEDTPLSVPGNGVLANDTDADSSSVTAALVSGPAHGTLTFNADGSFTYNAAANFNGADSFTYLATDGSLSSNVATVNLTVSSANDAPAAVDDNNAFDAVVESGLVAGDPSATGNVVTNDSDIDVGDSKTVSTVNGSAGGVGSAVAGTYGSVVIAADGTYTYTLDDADADTEALAQGAAAFDEFTYTVADGAGATSTAKLTIAITGAEDNAAPVAVDDAVSATEDVAIALSASSLLANDTDPDVGDTKTFVSVQNSTHGSVALADGTITFTPDANYNGVAGFAYTMQDSKGVQSSANVLVNVAAANDAPVNSVPGVQTTKEDTPLVFSAANGNAITVGDLDDADNGIAGDEVLQVNARMNVGGVLTLNGTAGLAFTLGDGTGDSQMTFTGTQTSINAALDGLVYTPSLNFVGAPVLTVTTNDQGRFGAGLVLTDADTVALTVAAVNDAPVITAAPTTNIVANPSFESFSNWTNISGSGLERWSTPFDGHVASNGTFLAELDVGGGLDVLTQSLTTQQSLVYNLTFDAAARQGTSASSNTFEVTWIGAVIDTITPTLTATSASDWNHYSYTVNALATASQLAFRDTGASNDGTGPLLDNVSVRATGGFAVREDVISLLPSISVSDVDAGTSALAVTVSVQHGTVTISTGSLTGITGLNTGTLSFTGTQAAVNAALATTLRYRSESNYNGADALTLTVSDQGASGADPGVTGGPGEEVAVRTFAMTVTPVNDAPVGVNDTNALDPVVEAGVAVLGDPTAAGNVLANDIDVDPGTVLTVSAVIGTAGNVNAIVAGTYGSVVIAADGTYTYTLNDADANTQALAAGASATDAFGYTLRDQTGLTSTATLSVAVTGSNDAPVAAASTNTWTAGGTKLVAATVAVFDNPLFVNTGGTLQDESDSIQSTLNSLGHTVSTFTDYSAAGLTAALSGKSVLMLPQQEAGDWGNALTDAAKQVIRDFVADGGSMVISADQRQTMNEIFGFNTSIGLAPLGITYGATAAAGGTTFGDGLASLPAINSVYGVSKVSLPGGAVSMFESGDVSGAAVIPFGDGQVTYVGWSWWNLPHYTNSGEAQPWLRVLDAAISKAADPVSEAGVNADGSAFAGDPGATGNVLLNDIDPDAGATKSVTAVNGADSNVGAPIAGTYGSVVINANGSYAYTLDNADADTEALAQGQIGHDVFAYTMADQFGATDTANLTIDIRGTRDAVNQPPIAVADTAGTPAGTAIFINVLANDVDPEGGALTLADVLAPASEYGAAISISGNQVFYDPRTSGTIQSLSAAVPAGGGGAVTDSFSYSVADSSGAVSSAMVHIQVLLGTPGDPTMFV